MGYSAGVMAVARKESYVKLPWKVRVSGVWGVGEYEEEPGLPERLRTKWPERMFGVALLRYERIEGADGEEMEPYEEVPVIVRSQDFETGESAIFTQKLGATHAKSIQGGVEGFRQIAKELVDVERQGNEVRVTGSDKEGEWRMRLEVEEGPLLMPVPVGFDLRVWGEELADKANLGQAFVNRGEIKRWAKLGTARLKVLEWPRDLPAVKRILTAVRLEMQMTAHEPEGRDFELRSEEERAEAEKAGE